MLKVLLTYVDGKIENNMESLGIKFYDTYNKILLAAFEVIEKKSENESENEQIYIQLVNSLKKFEELVTKLRKSKISYEDNVIFKNYNALLPSPTYYYKIKEPIDTKDKMKFNKHFKEIKESYKKIKAKNKK
ncbi:MAG: hypothetical protein HRU03_06235 [Nanoarchaeales archaeon]|nr:hypothetical protein [Nanoarchaeales archaeon]